MGRGGVGLARRQGESQESADGQQGDDGEGEYRAGGGVRRYAMKRLTIGRTSGIRVSVIIGVSSGPGRSSVG